MKFILNEGKYILNEADPTPIIKQPQNNQQPVPATNKDVDYRAVILKAVTKNGNDEKQADAIMNLGSPINFELEDLGFTENTNNFLTFLKSICQQGKPVSLDKLNSGNYAAIHNAYVYGLIDDNNLQNNTESMNILSCPNLYERQPAEILNVYLKIYHDIIRSDKKNLDKILNIVFNNAFNRALQLNNGTFIQPNDPDSLKLVNPVNFSKIILSETTDIRIKAKAFNSLSTAIGKISNDVKSNTAKAILAAKPFVDATNNKASQEQKLAILDSLANTINKALSRTFRVKFEPAYQNFRSSKEAFNKVKFLPDASWSDQDFNPIFKNFDFNVVPPNQYISLLTEVYNTIVPSTTKGK